MTDEQKQARKISAESGHIKWIKDNCLRTMADNEDYVFISYKSDDYERALDGILYQVCRKYGLRVYFDVAFDDSSDSWIKQFYENMSDEHCKAMIAFISNKYYSSYATLMEMMARKTCAAGGDYNFDTLRLIPIILEDIKPPLDSGANTGLGTVRFKVDDGVKEVPEANVKLELERFNEIFEELLDEDRKLKPLYKGLKKTKFYKEAIPALNLPQEGELFLKVSQCRAIMQKVLPSFTAIDGKTKNFEDAIHDMLVTPGPGSVSLGSVFIPDWVPIPPQPVEPCEQHDRPKPVVMPVPPKHPMSAKIQTISLPAFLKKYKHNTFKKETFQQVRLVGSGEYAKYNTEFFNSTSPLTRSFLRTVLEERGQDYIDLVRKKYAQQTLPFMTEEEYQHYIEDIKARGKKSGLNYQKLDISGLDSWLMCTNYSQYTWIVTLSQRIDDLGLPLEAFSLEYIPNSDELAETPETTGEKEETQTGGIKGPVRLNGKTGNQKASDRDAKTGKQKTSALEKNGYTFTLFGVNYSGLKLKDMLLTVSKATLDRHPERLDLLLNSLSCLGEGIKISSDAKPSYFRAGETIEINGRSITIGTSQNQDSVLTNIKKLMQLCGEPKDCLVIDGYDL